MPLSALATTSMLGGSPLAGDAAAGATTRIGRPLDVAARTAGTLVKANWASPLTTAGWVDGACVSRRVTLRPSSLKKPFWTPSTRAAALETARLATVTSALHLL